MAVDAKYVREDATLTCSADLNQVPDVIGSNAAHVRLAKLRGGRQVGDAHMDPILDAPLLHHIPAERACSVRNAGKNSI